MNATAVSPSPHKFTLSPAATTARYARCVEVSKRVNWEIDRDIFRGRSLDADSKFLPDSLSFVDRLPFLDEAGKRLLSQVQGRTYANIFGLSERFIGAKVLEVTGGHWLGDQTALEALVRFAGEELKHQELFRRLEEMIAAELPPGYSFPAQADEVAKFVLTKSTWSVLALTCMIELFTQVHYSASIEPDRALSPVFKDVFLFHWKEESQHAVLDELEWLREHSGLSAAQRDAAVDDLIALAGAVDGILQAQAALDAHYFADIHCQPLSDLQVDAVHSTVLAAYRWQFIGSGVRVPRFMELLEAMTTQAQGERIAAALAPILE